MPTNQRQIIEQVKYAYFSRGKALEKQIGILESLNPSNEKGELKQIESILPQNLMNAFIRVKLKEIANLQHIIKADKQYYKSKAEKFIILVNSLYLCFFKGHT